MRGCRDCYFYDVCDGRFRCGNFYPLDEEGFIPESERARDENEFRKDWTAYWLDRYQDGLLDVPEDE